MKSWIAALFSVLATSLALRAADVPVLTSPDGRIELGFSLREVGGSGGCPSYSVKYRGQTVIVRSGLGLDLKDEALRAGFRVDTAKVSEKDETWKPVWGPESSVRDHHRQVDVTLISSNASAQRLVITFRISDEGVAFQYTLPELAGRSRIEVKSEASEFRFAADHQAWPTYNAQGAYTSTPLSQLRTGAERPLVVRVAPDVCVALAEAKLVDHARMKFEPVTGGLGVVSKLAGPCVHGVTMTTPWRVIMIADRPGALVENGRLLLSLNDPCALADTSWIKPGKVIREITLTTTGGKACVDFAVKRGLQYIEYDAGWYGHEYDPTSDASAVHLDPKRSKGPLDLHEVIRYAAERDIGVILYVNHLAAEKQLDQILPLYRTWGVKGVKYGFVNVGEQKWTSWLHEAIRKAAVSKLMVDVHDEYRPTGYSRTYPNLMTVEGVRGDEETPPAEQTLAGAFIRTIAGPADHTVCYFDGRVDRTWTHAYQLAKPLCWYSAWQFLFWYDRPDRISQDEPELSLWNAMPATWDESRVLEGEIGRDMVVARRTGKDWFIGGMNAGAARDFQVTLAFLPPGQNYVAEIFRHDASSPSTTRVQVMRFAVDCSTTIKVPCGKADGFAVRLTPRRDGDSSPAYPR